MIPLVRMDRGHLGFCHDEFCLVPTAPGPANNTGWTYLVSVYVLLGRGGAVVVRPKIHYSFSFFFIFFSLHWVGKKMQVVQARLHIKLNGEIKLVAFPE